MTQEHSITSQSIHIRHPVLRRSLMLMMIRIYETAPGDSAVGAVCS